MMILAVVAVILGIGSLIQMIFWCIVTWREATADERKIERFEKFSKMMRDTDLKSWK